MHQAYDMPHTKTLGFRALTVCIACGGNVPVVAGSGDYFVVAASISVHVPCMVQSMTMIIPRR